MNIDLTLVFLTTGQVLVGKQVGEVESNNIVLEKPVQLNFIQNENGGINMQPGLFPIPFMQRLITEKALKTVVIKERDILLLYSGDQLLDDIKNWYISVTSRVEIATTMPKGGIIQ